MYFLFGILSNFWSNECVPHDLKRTILRPFLKDSTKDASDPSNYRPISILSCISKLIEKLTYNRLIKYIENRSILHSNQFGFRSAHSTVHAITAIHEKILENVDNSKHTISIYLDLSKAFDSVNHSTGCFFYSLSYSIWPHALILGPILLIDLSISSHYYAQSNEVSIIILSLLCVEF